MSSSYLLRGMWVAYCKRLQTHPVLTRSFTSMAGLTLGDVLAQCATSDAFSQERTLRFATFGFFLHGPLCYQFYKRLDSMVHPHKPRSLRTIGTKLIIDQGIWSPIFILIFYISMKMLEGQPKEIHHTIKEKYWTTLMSGYSVWIPAHIVNYSFVPPVQRVFYVNCVNVVWNAILSTIAENPTTKPK